MNTRPGASFAVSENVAGSLWMVLAMAGFALEDAAIKAVATTLPVAQILVLFGAGGALVFAGMARVRREALFTSAALAPVMQIRAAFEVTGRLFYTLAIALTPLASATAILQATPLVVVAGAALFLGERVGWRRWSAILLGFGGVLLVLRPGGDDFSVLSILAVLGMIGFAGRDLASRAAPPGAGVAVLGFYGFLAIIVAGALYAFWSVAVFVTPGGLASGMLCIAILAGVFAYSALMRAMRTGEVAVVTPFRYSRLLFAMVLAMALFGEIPDGQTLAGCFVIILSGLFVAWRGAPARNGGPSG